jgi:hypothetical protein
MNPSHNSPIKGGSRCAQAAGWGFCLALVLVLGCRAASPSDSSGPRAAWLKSWRAANPVWRGVHLSAHNDEQAGALMAELPKLAGLGVNVIVLEVDYSFQFRSYPELASSQGLSQARARALAQAARQQGLRLIPQLNCLGHQSWGKTTGRLLEKHPEFDETPGQFPDNQGIYCRSWCPQNPAVNAVVFALIDELCEAFEADAFHVGMDEVFEKQAAYPSVPLLLQKGFRVWPSGWQPLEATQAFSAYARQQNDKRLLGYLCTTWGKVKIADTAQWPPVAEVLPAWRRAAEIRSPK